MQLASVTHLPWKGGLRGRGDVPQVRRATRHRSKPGRLRECAPSSPHPSSGQDEQISWAQCDNCDKWRIIVEKATSGRFVASGTFECEMAGKTCETTEDQDPSEDGACPSSKDRAGRKVAVSFVSRGRFKQVQFYPSWIDDSEPSGASSDESVREQESSEDAYHAAHRSTGQASRAWHGRQDRQTGDTPTCPDSPALIDAGMAQEIIYDSPKELTEETAMVKRKAASSQVAACTIEWGDHP